VKPGSLSDLVKAASTLARDIRKDDYGKLAGYWLTEIGPLNQLVHLWGYADFGERSRLRGALGKNSRWTGEYLPLIRPLMMRQRAHGGSRRCPQRPSLYTRTPLSLEDDQRLFDPERWQTMNATRIGRRMQKSDTERKEPMGWTMSTPHQLSQGSTLTKAFGSDARPQSVIAQYLIKYCDLHLNEQPVNAPSAGVDSVIPYLMRVAPVFQILFHFVQIDMPSYQLALL
jgi:hypothetical protein